MKVIALFGYTVPPKHNRTPIVEKKQLTRQQELETLSGKLNKYQLRTKEQIEKAVAGITKKVGGAFLPVEIAEELNTYEVQVGKGRPGPNTRYETVTNPLHAAMAAQFVRNFTLCPL